jgi:hypothetical protein
MAAKPGLIPAALMSSVMVPIVTCVVTVLDLGRRAGVLGNRVKARFLPRPIAAIAACLILPLARRLPERNVALIDGRY